VTDTSCVVCLQTLKPVLAAHSCTTSGGEASIPSSFWVRRLAQSLFGYRKGFAHTSNPTACCLVQATWCICSWPFASCKASTARETNQVTLFLQGFVHTNLMLPFFRLAAVGD
jgi:hypothetical protein